MASDKEDAFFVGGECPLAVLDPNKKRGLTPYHAKLTRSRLSHGIAPAAETN